MTYSLSEKDIAVIGDENFVKGFKLGGATIAFTINTKEQTNETIKAKVREVVGKVFENYKVGIVIIEENLKKYVEGFRKTSSQPLIIYLPGGLRLDKSKIKEYYNSLIRVYLGLSIEV